MHGSLQSFNPLLVFYFRDGLGDVNIDTTSSDDDTMLTDQRSTDLHEEKRKG